MVFGLGSLLFQGCKSGESKGKLCGNQRFQQPYRDLSGFGAFLSDVQQGIKQTRREWKVLFILGTV